MAVSLQYTCFVVPPSTEHYGIPSQVANCAQRPPVEWVQRFQEGQFRDGHVGELARKRFSKPTSRTRKGTPSAIIRQHSFGRSTK